MNRWGILQGCDRKTLPSPPNTELPAAPVRPRRPGAPATAPRRLGAQRVSGAPEPDALGPRGPAVAEAGAWATGSGARCVVKTGADQPAQPVLDGPDSRSLTQPGGGAECASHPLPALSISPFSP